MIDVIESLMKGEDAYPRAFATAQRFWGQFYSEHGDAGDTELQKAIESAQMPFQWRLEKEAGLAAPFAKSIMALTAIGALYRDGFEDEKLAKRVVQIFITSSTLSGGVKSAAKEVAAMYGLA